MKSWDKKETTQRVTHKRVVNLQKIKRDKRQKGREECREHAIALQRRMTTRVTEHEENSLDLGHDRQEEGVYEEVSPMEEDLWIEQCEALQIELPQDIRPLSPINSNVSARVQFIVEEDLTLGVGDFCVWS